MNPFPTMGETFEKALRMVLPYTVIMLFFFLNTVSFSNVGAHFSEYPFFLITLYYWFIHRPTLLPMWLVFLAGVVMDAMTGAPLGLNALLFGILRVVITSQRRFLIAQTFPVVWIIFAMVLLAHFFLQWVLHSLIAWRVLSLEGVELFMLGGILIFPILTILLHATHKLLPVLGVQRSMRIR